MAEVDAGLSSFTEALRVDDDGAVLGAIVSELAKTAQCEHALFFEGHAEEHSFRAVGAASDGAQQPRPVFASRGALARWLRVNDDILMVRDSRGPWDDLSDDERGGLQSLAAVACVPLVSGGRLVAFVVLRDGRDRWTLSRGQVSDLMLRARHAAATWQTAQQRAARRERMTASYRAEQLSTAGQLAAAIAHEVRNPLAIIRSSVQLVRDARPTASEQEDLLRDVMGEVDRIDRTVDGFLQLSRPHETAAIAVDVGELTRETARFVATYARRLNVELIVDPADVDDEVRVDPRELRQVLLNVMLNACQACAAGGRVRITIGRNQADGGWVQIVVADSGCGMTAADVEQAFTPFFTTKPKGTGLGLSVCREILRAYGGAISLTSAVGAGTSVLIALPPSEAHGAHPGR